MFVFNQEAKWKLKIVFRVKLQKKKIKLSCLDIQGCNLGNIIPTHVLSGLVLSTTSARLVSFPFYRGRNQALEKLNDLIKIIQLLRVRAGI